MASSESHSATSSFVNERLRALENEIQDLKSLVQGESHPSSREGVKVIQLSDDELAVIRSTLESNSEIAASPSAMAGRKILIMVDPPGVCFDYSNF
jgi:hypothetical protein